MGGSDTVSYVGTAGDFIPFDFTSPNTPTGPTTRTNGDATNNPSDAVTTIYSYATVLFDAGSISQVKLTDMVTNYFVAAFDDSGAGPDDNHDDFMVPEGLVKSKGMKSPAVPT